MRQVVLDHGDARQLDVLVGSGSLETSSREVGHPYGGSSRLAMASRKRLITLGWVRKAIRCILHEHLGHWRTSMPKTIWSNCAQGVRRPYRLFSVSSLRMQHAGEGLGLGGLGTTSGRSFE